MEIQRTANAGVLLRLDGVAILLDGLCSRIEPYEETPSHIAEEFFRNPPDLLAFTHAHADHFGQSLVSEHLKQNLRPVLGPESLPYGTDHDAMQIGNIKITPIRTRHLGKTEPGLQHVSFLIEGSKRVLFTGDAAPLQWKGTVTQLDVLIAPYAYANTTSSWNWCGQVSEKTVLLHLPEKGNDPFCLWKQVEAVAGGYIGTSLLIPKVGETVTI